MKSNQDMSSWILERCIPAVQEYFLELTAQLGGSSKLSSHLFANLHDFLRELDAAQLQQLELHQPYKNTMSYNYLAAMIEYRAEQLGVEPPRWTSWIQPYSEPYFGTDLKSLKEYLLLRSPLVFRRRNLFMDATLGDRV